NIFIPQACQDPSIMSLFFDDLSALRAMDNDTVRDAAVKQRVSQAMPFAHFFVGGVEFDADVPANKSAGLPLGQVTKGTAFLLTILLRQDAAVAAAVNGSVLDPVSVWANAAADHQPVYDAQYPRFNHFVYSSASHDKDTEVCGDPSGPCSPSVSAADSELLDA